MRGADLCHAFFNAEFFNKERKIHMKKDIIINDELKSERRTLSELLDITPERYKTAILTKNHFPAIIVNTLQRFRNINNVCELLYFSPYELMTTTNMGEKRFKQLMESLIKYCKDYKGKPAETTPVDTQTGRLFCAMRCMLDEHTPPRFDFDKQEQKYLHDFKFAIVVMPHDILEHELNNATEIINLRKVIFTFYKMEDRI